MEKLPMVTSMVKSGWSVAALCLTATVLGSACGGAKDLCVERRIRCDGALTCEPESGLCKCGGRGGVLCAEGFTCDGATNTCLSSKCVGVTCSGGTSCDVTDGKCRCGGTGGKECDPGDICESSTRTC